MNDVALRQMIDALREATARLTDQCRANRDAGLQAVAAEPQRARTPAAATA